MRYAPHIDPDLLFPEAPGTAKQLAAMRAILGAEALPTTVQLEEILAQPLETTQQYQLPKAS